MREEIVSFVNIKNFSEKDLIHSNAIKSLENFVGIWTVTGQNGPLVSKGPSEHVSGTEVYEWLEGERFMVYRWHRSFGKDKHIGLAVFGYDEEKRGLFAQFFDNFGFMRRYAVKLHEGRMHLEGTNERATIAVDNNVMNIFWQTVKDGQVTGILCELEGRRTQ